MLRLTFDDLKQHDFVTRWKATQLLMLKLWIRICNFCNEPFSCSCCNQYLMFWSNKMKSYSAAIAVNKNLQFMLYTLSTLLSSFPWTTQKSIIVENSKIVDDLAATKDFYLIKIHNSRNSKIVELFFGEVVRNLVFYQLFLP